MTSYLGNLNFRGYLMLRFHAIREIREKKTLIYFIASFFDVG